MYYAHHFAHRETLHRACDWLNQFGFHPEEIGRFGLGIPRLAMHVEPGRLSEVELLINAVETTDPQGWPSFWDEVMIPRAASTTGFQQHRANAGSRPSAVGWHPVDLTEVPAVELEKIHEGMGH